MSGNWLQAYLAASTRRNLCTRIHCTTCGALEFRYGVLDALSQAMGRPPQRHLDRVAGLDVARGLAVIASAAAREISEEAVRCILFDLWSRVPMSVEELHSLLGRTWSGQVLKRMQQHYAARLTAQRARATDEDPQAVQHRRAEKQRMRQERHRQRLALQRERSRLWHEKHDSRRALDELFTLARRYTSSEAYRQLLDFVARFRFYAPFNAMLVHVQMEGATFVAPPHRWLRDYGRRIAPDARPLVILQPMGPVMFVFDVSDTIPLDGAPALPAAVERPFEVRRGRVGGKLPRMIENAIRDGVEVVLREAGSQSAGKIRTAAPGRTLRFPKSGAVDKVHQVPVRYELMLNADHSPEARYATLAHELAHLYCGHLGTPNERWWPDRRNVPRDVRELEAESVAYLICRRHGIDNPSEEYLSAYTRDHVEMPPLSLDCVMKAAGLIEQMARERLTPRKEKRQ